MFIRKLGKFIRGSVSSFQIILAVFFGGILAFLPEFGSAPGLYIALFFAVLLLNANLFLLGISFLGLTLLALLLTPLTFQVGVFLLDGPLRGLFKILINGPVTAWFGFEYYLTTGGLILGALVGLVLGAVIANLLRRFQRLMARMEGSSELYQKVSAKVWFRLTMFIFFGGIRGKKSFKQIAEEGTGRGLIRPLGVIVVLLLAGLIFIGGLFLDDKIVREVVRGELEKANGATVDLESFELKPAEGRVTIQGLAFADASNLEKNAFSAGTLQADLGLGDLLAKQFTINSIIVEEARSGNERKVKGQIIQKPRKEKDSKLPEILKKPGEMTVEDIMDQYPIWKQRLTQLKAWLENASQKKEKKMEEGPSLRERLREQARQLGYSRVVASHLITGKPTLTIESIAVNTFRLADLPDEVFSLKGSFLSTQPNLLEEAPEIDINTQSDRYAFFFQGGNLSAGSGQNQLDFHLYDLPLQQIKSMAPPSVDIPLESGMVDIEAKEAILDGSRLDIDLGILLQEASVRLENDQILDLPELSIPARIEGPINQPRLTLDPSTLQNILQKALEEKAKGIVEDKVKKELDKKVGDEIKDVLPGGLDSLFNKKK